MTAKEWIETILPGVAKRLSARLQELDTAPEVYAGTPTGLAMYHLSRHTEVLNATPGRGLHSRTKTKRKPVAKLPARCGRPWARCKALALSRALLACPSGAPGIGGGVVVRFSDAVRAARPLVSRALQILSPPTKDLVGTVGPNMRAIRYLRPAARGAVRRLVAVHDRLVQCLGEMLVLDREVMNEFASDATREAPGRKHHHNHLDQIMTPLFGAYTDKEIAELVPDGENPGEGGELAQARVANRRKKLTGSRKGGRPGKPGRPRKAQRET